MRTTAPAIRWGLLGCATAMLGWSVSCMPAQRPIDVNLAPAAAGIDAEMEPTAADTDAVALAASYPLGSRADLDTATSACEDFYQYATGAWYRRHQLSAPRLWQIGMTLMVDTTASDTSGRSAFPSYGLARVGEALRQFVARTPALANTTKDPTLRVVGVFYGSCLADASGTAEGAIGDTTRAHYCFDATRRVLDRAVFELLMEYLWPPQARAESRLLWPTMQAAGNEHFQASQALSDSVKRRLIATTEQDAMHAMGGAQSLDSTDRSDSISILWPAGAAASRPAGVRGPSDVPFAGTEAAATWIYRDYAKFKLSPTDFLGNVAQLTAAPDTVPPPGIPGADDNPGKPQALLDMLLDHEIRSAGGTATGEFIPFNDLILPLVDGQPDYAAWYGLVAPILGHEMGHDWDHVLNNYASEAERAAFDAEQFRGQLQDFHHPFDDAIGVLVAYDAFQQAQGRWPRAKLDGFTPAQRFFLGVAWGWRGGPLLLDPTWVFTPSRWRAAVNGTLSTMPAFAKAFGCKTGDPMTGGVIWYQAPWGQSTLDAWQRAELARSYEQTLQDRLGQLLGRGPGALTAEQQAVFAARRQTHQTARQALLGVRGQPGRVGSLRELYGLMARELGEVRAVLTDEQRTAFDSTARDGLVLGWPDGTRISIPGVP